MKSRWKINPGSKLKSKTVLSERDFDAGRDFQRFARCEQQRDPWVHVLCKAGNPPTGTRGAKSIQRWREPYVRKPWSPNRCNVGLRLVWGYTIASNFLKIIKGLCKWLRVPLLCQVFLWRVFFACFSAYSAFFKIIFYQNNQWINYCFLTFFDQILILNQLKRCF